MYYHFTLLELFRSTALLKIANGTINPREICLQAADAIQSLVHIYSQLYSLHLAPSFVSHFILASTSMHVLLDTGRQDLMDSGAKQEEIDAAGPAVSETIKTSIIHLTSMALSQNSAKKALQTLESLTSKEPAPQQFGS